jgi:hypothetical protein
MSVIRRRSGVTFPALYHPMPGKACKDERSIGGTGTIAPPSYCVLDIASRYTIELRYKNVNNPVP